MMQYFTSSITGRGGPQQLRKGVAGKTISVRRSQKIIKDAIQGITRPAIRRMARRGGVKRMSRYIYDEARQALRAHLAEILECCVIFVEHRNAKTVTTLDVLYALKRMGRPIYGFDPVMGKIYTEKRRRHEHMALRR